MLSELSFPEDNNINNTNALNIFNNCNNLDFSKTKKINEFSAVRHNEINSTFNKNINNRNINDNRCNNDETIKLNNLEFNENIAFPDISGFSDNKNLFNNSQNFKKTDNKKEIRNNFKNIKRSDNNLKSQISDNYNKDNYNNTINKLNLKDLSISSNHTNKINIRLSQSRNKKNVIDDLNFYSCDLLENTFKNLKINHKKIDNIMDSINKKSYTKTEKSKKDIVYRNLHRNPNNRFETISESSINNNFDSKNDRTMTNNRTNKFLLKSNKKDFQPNSLSAYVDHDRYSLLSSSLKFYEINNKNNTNSISYLKLKDIDHEEYPNQVILRVDRDTNVDRINVKEFCLVESLYDSKNKINCKENNKLDIDEDNKFDDSIVEILKENNNINNKISMDNTTETYNKINIIHRNSGDGIQKIKKLERKISKKMNKDNSPKSKDKDMSLISNTNFQVLSESLSDSPQDDKKELLKDNNNNKNDFIFDEFNNQEQLILFDNVEEKFTNLQFNNPAINKHKRTNYKINSFINNLDTNINLVNDKKSNNKKNIKQQPFFDLQKIIKTEKKRDDFVSISPIRHICNTTELNKYNNNHNYFVKLESSNNFEKVFLNSPKDSTIENVNIKEKNYLLNNVSCNNINFSILNTILQNNINSNLTYINNNKSNNSEIEENIKSKNYKDVNLRAFSLSLLNNKDSFKYDLNKKNDNQEFSIEHVKLKGIVEDEKLISFEDNQRKNYNNSRIFIDNHISNIKIINSAIKKNDIIHTCSFNISNQENKKNNLNVDKEDIVGKTLNENNLLKDNDNRHKNSIKSFNFTFMRESSNNFNSNNFNLKKNFASMKIDVFNSFSILDTSKKLEHPDILGIANPINLEINSGNSNKKKRNNLRKTSNNDIYKDRELKISKQNNINIENKEPKYFDVNQSKNISNILDYINDSIEGKDNRNFNEKNINKDISDIINKNNNSTQTLPNKEIFNSVFTLKIYRNTKIENKIIIYAGGENVIKFWDYEKNKIIKTFKGHKNHIYCLKQINEDLFLSGSLDKTIKLWDINNESCLKTYIFHIKAISNLMKIHFKLNKYSENYLNDIIICSAGWDGYVKFFNLDSNEVKSAIKITLPRNAKNKVKLEHDNFLIDESMKNNHSDKNNFNGKGYVNNGNKSEITRINNNENEFNNENNLHNPVTSMKKIKLINQKEIKYLLAVAGKKINIYKVYQRLVLYKKNKDNKYHKIDDYLPNEKKLNLDSNSERFRKVLKKDLIIELSGHEGYINDMKYIILENNFFDENKIKSNLDNYDYNLDKIHLLTVGNDKDIKLWNINRRENIRTFSGHTDSVRCLLRIKYFSDDNDRIFASGGSDENIIIWNLKTGKILDRLLGHKDGILCLKQVNNKDKFTIVSGSGGYNEEPLKIWK